MHHYPESFIRAIPKTDLHLHLDGSLRLGSLIELARDASVELPSTTETGLRETVFRERYANLDEYLRGFAYTCRVLQTPDALERASYELALDCFADGARYIEVRFAPQLHMGGIMSFEEVMGAADRGLKRARTELNRGISTEDVEFEYGIIVCAMRFCTAGFSAYYRQFFDMHRYTAPEEVIRMLSAELIRATVKLRRESDVQIVGFDLAGSENGHPAERHSNAYDYAHKSFLMKTVHAGEAYGPESIFQAITVLHADRIGHGFFLFAADKIVSNDVKDPERYVRDLSNYIAEKRITLEVCLTSNLQTVPEIGSIMRHPFGRMLENRLSVSLCTDNRLVSHTDINKEYLLAVNNFPIAPKELKDIVIYGFKRSFFPRSYTEKRTYVRKVIAMYERLEREAGLATQS